MAAVMVALLFSPPLTVFLELTLYALMLGSGELRGRLLRAVRQPLGATALAFWAFAAIGMAYSAAPFSESFAIWFSWRRLLLLVIGLALFDERVWKNRVVWILVIVAAATALVSYLGALFEFSFRHFPSGILLRNHAVQGLIFAVAAFSALAMLASGPGIPRSTRILILTFALLIAMNVAFVTTSRSGHAVIAVLAIALALGWPSPAVTLFKRAAWALTAIVLVSAMLASSPVVRQRIALAVDEIQNPAPPNAVVSSMEERLIYTSNTVELIKQRPVFGHGTGGFETAYARIVEGRVGLAGIKAHDPHNQYLSILAQHGVVGLLLFLGLLGAALRQEVSAAPYRLLGLSVLAAWCATSLFSSHFSTFAEGRFIWLWLGVCLARE